MRRKCGFCIGSLLTALSAAFGCWNGSETQPETEPALPFAGQQIGVAVPAELDVRDRWVIMLDEWSAQTGARPELSQYELAKETASQAEFVNATSMTSSQGGPSLLVFPMTRVAELAAEGALAHIPEARLSAAELNWIDVFQGLRDNVASVDGRAPVVPLSSLVFICYYRRDLLDRAGLVPPRAAQFFNLRNNDLRVRVAGVEPKASPQNALRWGLRCASTPATLPRLNN